MLILWIVFEIWNCNHCGGKKERWKERKKKKNREEKEHEDQKQEKSLSVRFN